MSSAVLDRILAIPDYDDRPQMGLSRSGLAAIVERGGLTKDGTKAKASVLQRAGIKGDRKLTPEIAAKAKKAIAKTKDANPLSKQIAKIGVADLIRKQEKETQPFWDRINDGEELSPSDVAKYQKIDARQTKERIEAKEKVKSLLIKNGEDQMGVDIISANLGNQASEWDRLVKLAAKDEIKSRKVIKGKSPRDRQSQSTNTAIAPDTAKKVKRAIAGVKGGKVNQASLKRNLYQAAVVDTIKDYKQKNKWDFPIPTTSTKKTSEGEYAVYTFPTNRDAKLAKDLIAKDYKGIEVKGNTITHPANTSMKNFKKIFTLAKRAK